MEKSFLMLSLIMTVSEWSLLLSLNGKNHLFI